MREHNTGEGWVQQLTLGKRLQLAAKLQVELLEGPQLSKAFGQQTGEQLVHTTK